ECGKIDGRKATKNGQKLRILREEKCDECGKNSNSGSDFEIRNSTFKDQGTQTGEKHFECVECGKSFAQNSALAKHRRAHSGE
ncbi:ZN394 protein, partial [Calcarius ornatus]|nr:ZN394 protein [Calcarius ornatus]